MKLRKILVLNVCLLFAIMMSGCFHVAAQKGGAAPTSQGQDRPVRDAE